MQDLHPILVHIPIAAIPATVLFGLWFLLNRQRRGLQWAFRACLVAAALFAVAAVLTGHRAEGHAEAVVPAILLEQHEEYATIAMWLILGATVVELATVVPKLKPRAFPLSALAFVIALASLVTVALAGHRGAEMVYKYGAGIGHVLGPSPNVTVVPASGAEPPEPGVEDED